MTQRRDQLGFLDHFALWAVLGASLYVMPFGSLLVPALSIEKAILAVLAAAAIGGLIIASLAAVAANSGHSTVELLSEPFGPSARWPIAILLLARHLLFTVFALTLIADAAELASDRALGAGLRPLWVAVFAAAGIGMLALGPGRAAALIRRVGVWLVLLVALAVTASAYMEFEVPAYLRRPAVGGWPAFWQAVDVMLIFPLLWLPVVADFSRRSAGARAAVRGSFLGTFVTVSWFGALGVVYLPAVDSTDIPGFVVGMQLGLGALLVVLLLQVDEVYANSYGAGPTLEMLDSAGSERIAAGCLVGVAAPLAALSTTASLEGYVWLTASVFIPAAAIVISRAAVAGARPAAVPAVAWVGGFLLYQWIVPADIGWWHDSLDSLFGAAGAPYPLADEVDWLGAAIPAFLFAFALDSLWVVAGRTARFISARTAAP